MIETSDYFYVNLDDTPDEAPPCFFCKVRKSAKLVGGIPMCRLCQGFTD